MYSTNTEFRMGQYRDDNFNLIPFKTVFLSVNFTKLDLNSVFSIYYELNLYFTELKLS